MKQSIRQILRNKCPACKRRFHVPNQQFRDNNGRINCPLCQTPIRRSKQAILNERYITFFVLLLIGLFVYAEEIF